MVESTPVEKKGGIGYLKPGLNGPTAVGSELVIPEQRPDPDSHAARAYRNIIKSLPLTNEPPTTEQK